MPLELKLRGKSTAQSSGRPIYYVDLVVRTGLSLEEAITQAREIDARRNACGFDQVRLDDAARAGFEAGLFEDGDEDGASAVEELFPPIDATMATTAAAASAPLPPRKHGLRERS